MKLKEEIFKDYFMMAENHSEDYHAQRENLVDMMITEFPEMTCHELGIVLLMFYRYRLSKL
jgi:hypothetical protein